MPAQLVTKDALLEAVWPKTTVSEAVLQVAIRQLRRVLGDQARPPRFIEQRRTVGGIASSLRSRPLPASADTARLEASPTQLRLPLWPPLHTSLGATPPSPNWHSGGPRHDRASGKWG